MTITIPEKANRVLNVILLCLLLVAARVWFLSVVQHDKLVEESRRPQKRTVVDPARRATIRDRFNLPLAINKVQYQATLLYSQIAQIPSIKWVKDTEGKRVRQFKRKEHIGALSRLLGEELQLDPSRLEDLIHSKATLFYHIPFVIKENLTEREYYRLKMLEKDWLGVHVQIAPRRTYPQGKVAADLIGYMGAISREEYERIIHELKALEQYVQEEDLQQMPPLPAGFSSSSQIRARLKELRELAYTVHDYVGKSGIEGRFEELLRGYHGKKSFISDARGNFLRELPGSREPLPGKRLLLTISSELQAYAEQLLVQNERIREAQVSKPSLLSNPSANKQPWMKGGAIIVMDPLNGEVLALASYPRFDPNDFILSGSPEEDRKKRNQIMRWFESEAYLAQVWDQKRPLERERYDDDHDQFFEEAVWLSWESYLGMILPPEGSIYRAMIQSGTIKGAVDLQRSVSMLLGLSGQDSCYQLLDYLYKREQDQPHHKKGGGEVQLGIELQFNQSKVQVQRLRQAIDSCLGEILHNDDKCLMIDLCQLAVQEDLFTPELLAAMGKQRLSTYRDASAAFTQLIPAVREIAAALYHDFDFAEWREREEREFLRKKREEEKVAHQYPKPYTDHLDEQERVLFEEFWQKNKWDLLLSFLLKDEGVEAEPSKELAPYVTQMVQWHQELLAGGYAAVSWRMAYMTLHQVLSGIPRALRVPYMQTFRSFHDLKRPLLGKYRMLRSEGGVQLEKHLALAFYPRYGFGSARSHGYRQATVQGSLFKLVTAYAALVQRYRDLELRGKNLSVEELNPLEIVDVVQRRGKELLVGFHQDGRPIPRIYKGGRLPASSAKAIGRINIIHALEMSSNPYFSLLAGDFLNDPDDLIKAARLFSYGEKTGIDLLGEISGRLPTDLHVNRTGLYSLAIGQHSLVVTPLQTTVMLSTIANGGKVLRPKIVRMAVESYQTEGENSSSFGYQESLGLAGIDFLLFSAVEARKKQHNVESFPTMARRNVFMPGVVREILLEGMDRVVAKMQHSSLTALSRFYRDYPDAISDYLELSGQLVGKTGTSESVENMDLDRVTGTDMYTHVWFGGIAFNQTQKGKETWVFRDRFGQPELVVTAYLRFGKFGREAAPIAAQMVKKWREIKARNQGTEKMERNGVEPLTSTMPLLRSTN